MKKIPAIILLGILTLFTQAQAQQDWYEIKIYSLNKPEQEKRVDDFLKDAYIPTMHKLGYKNIGVFKPVESDTSFGKKIYVLTVFPSVQKYTELQSVLNKNKEFNDLGKDYLQAAYDNVPYKRIESIVLKAFPKHLKLTTPKLSGKRSERIYELRSYESHTEKISENKIKMFNDGDEVGLFARLNFNAVFYGEVVVGSHMPNLMYLTTFENKQDRDEHWKAFSSDSQWAKLKVDPQYQNNVSKNVQLFLFPTEYSDY